MNGMITEASVAMAHQRKVRHVESILSENRSWKNKYKDLLVHLESGDPAIQRRVMNTIQAMHNQAMYVEGLSRDPRMEATFVQNLGQLVPKVVDLVRIFYPNMVTHDLVDVQTIDRQNGEIFVIRPTFSDTAAGVQAGDQVFKTVTDGTYASERTNYTLTGTGVGPYTGTASRLPLRPGRQRLFVGGVQVGVDTSQGNFVGTNIDTSSINYDTGAFSVSWTTGNAPSGPVSVGTVADLESNPQGIRKLSINLSTIPVQAQPHPLLIDWSVQAQLAAAAHLDVDVPQTLADAVASFIKQERDITLINSIRGTAVHDANLDFDAAPPSNYSKLAKYAEIETKLNFAESDIQVGQGRGGVSWVLCGTNAADIWRHAASFEPSDVVAPIGPHKIGTLRDGTVAVIKVPSMDRNTYVIGFKGYVMGDAATILAEWIPLYATPVFQSPTMVNSQGLTSLYHLEANNMVNYYRFGEITNYNA